MTHTILRLPEVKTRTGLSRSSIYLRMANNEFPKPISLGGRAVGWVEHDVDDWIVERIELSRLNDHE
ncbi:helix-turn-helix transcriptional regulator [Reinekea sp.]|jgi:prophage regulatory protein|uniref:helix-turn-helix transcriptional regulator n=1 Tax=Reinekea sp. TaxID=1970455 RepID=UPI003989836D